MAQCVIPLLLRHLKIPSDRITVMDMRDNRDHVASALERGVKYVQERITPDHFQEQPHEFVLGIARPYLGTFRSGPTDWSPNVSVPGNVGECHEKATQIEGATNDHWQFGNFLIE